MTVSTFAEAPDLYHGKPSVCDGTLSQASTAPPTPDFDFAFTEPDSSEDFHEFHLDITDEGSKGYADAGSKGETVTELANRTGLRTLDMDGVARYILEHGIGNIVVMCGAGISTSAGIPDFRTPGTGLYDNLQRFDLPEPEAVFTLDFFQDAPDAFYELCRDMWPGNYSPTPCHHFIRLLHEKGALLRCYTQNIDSLERQAGLPADKIIAAHGNFDTAHVVDDLDIGSTPWEVDINELKDALDVEGTAGWEALRAEHGGLVKPRITFFGERLPERFLSMYNADLKNCELLVVLGTSLQVEPFNCLVGLAPVHVPRLLINREPSGKEDDLAGGFKFDLPENRRDVWHHSDCDSGVRELAQKLGWAHDLARLIESKVDQN